MVEEKIVNKQKKSAKKNIKKQFFEVAAPMTATKLQLYAATPEELKDRIIRLDLSKNLRGKNLELKLRVKYEDKQLYAEPESLILVSSYCKKVMRRGSDYVEDSFVVECRDCIARFKPFLITRRRASRLLLNTLRQTTKEHIIAYGKTRSSKELFSEITTNKFQKQLSLKLKKIYPLALCEIRMFEIVSMKEGSEKMSAPSVE